MRSILTSIFLLCSMAIFAQGNLVVFSEDGHNFHLLVNGKIQNAQPQSNVRVTGLTHPNYRIKVRFEDTSLGEIDKNVMIEANTEFVAVIKKTKKGKWVIRYQSSTPLAQSTESSGQSTVIYNPNGVAPTTVQTTATQSSTGAQTNVQSTSTTTTTTHQTTNEGGGENINVNINMGGLVPQVGGSVSVSGSSTTTTTTTTTTSGSQQMNTNTPPPSTAPGSTHQPADDCPYTMNSSDFQSAKTSINSKSFEDSKLTMAKQIAKSNCFSTDQVVALCNLFTYEDTKLEFAKFAYSKTQDKGNYFKVNDVFTYESSIDELNEFLEAQ